VTHARFLAESFEVPLLDPGPALRRHQSATGEILDLEAEAATSLEDGRAPAETVPTRAATILNSQILSREQETGVTFFRRISHNLTRPERAAASVLSNTHAKRAIARLESASQRFAGTRWGRREHFLGQNDSALS
jgi:hypothetical protein